MPANKNFLCVRGVPDTLQRAFKSRCAADGFLIRDVINHLMREYIRMRDEEKKEEGA